MSELNGSATIVQEPPKWMLERLGQVRKLAVSSAPIEATDAKAVWDRVHMDGVAALAGGGVVRAVVLGPDPETYEGVAMVFIEGGVSERVLVRGESIQGVHFERALYVALTQYRSIIRQPERAFVQRADMRRVSPEARTVQVDRSEEPDEAVIPVALNTLDNRNPVDVQIIAALNGGVVLGEADVRVIRDEFARAAEFDRRAIRVSSLGADPMNKGHSFPLGVGFTRMTKRASQRLDASVRRAGQAVKLYQRAEQARNFALALLAGKGTRADALRRRQMQSTTQELLIRELLGWVKGKSIMQLGVTRVNRDRDGYPVSFTIEGQGIVKGVSDKVDVVREFFAGNKLAFRSLVDRIRLSTT
ncbi:hypothetical protein LA345_40225 (plasmid) [Burkholderia vietnamiensis]|nr:hypothetical protein [Burkholderia vietnamiensis]